MIGVNALAAVSVFFPIMIFLISFIIGLASGASILIGQAWGAKNIDKVKQVAGTTLTVAFVLGLVVAADRRLFTRDADGPARSARRHRRAGDGYGRIMLIGMPGFFIFLILTSMLRGVGDTVTPLMSQVFSIGVGLVVTPALIQGWFGLPQIGVLPRRWPSSPASWSCWSISISTCDRKKSPLAPDAALFRNLKIDFKLLGLILKLGIPAGVLDGGGLAVGASSSSASSTASARTPRRPMARSTRC